jgi:hypothetical protein
MLSVALNGHPHEILLSSTVNAPGQLIDGYSRYMKERFWSADCNKIQKHFVEHRLPHAPGADFSSLLTLVPGSSLIKYKYAC